jgi:tRNA nucleotidyltransferase/poly(A) polymerase
MLMCKLSEKAIDDILRCGRIYEVGGAVRARFMNLRSASMDRDYLVTGFGYGELTRILRPHGGSIWSAGVSASSNSHEFVGDKQYTFDITLPRREHSTGVAHTDFAVDFDPDLPVEDDLIRRDFTVNAMALALDTNELVDPLHGMVDLQSKTLRMTSSASFEEDPLRMLRAVQFAARFGFAIEPGTLEAMTANHELIRSVSEERIAEELTKLLVQAERPSEGFRIMQRTGLLREILPELEACVGVDQPGGYHRYDVFEHTLHCIDVCPAVLHLRLAALFHDINKPQAKRPTEDGGATFYGHEISGARTAVRALTRLRFSTRVIKDVETLVERHMFTTAVTDKGLRRLVKRVGQELIFDLLDLRRADVTAQAMGGTTEDVDVFEEQIRDELSRKPPFSFADLALNGEDIMRLFDLTPGRTVGDILNHLLESVLDNPNDNTAERLAELANAYYQKRINDRDQSKEAEQ